jgi:fructokinase
VTSEAGSAPAVLVAGDALVDLTPSTTDRGTLAYEPHAGGSCLNVAVGLARLGVPTAFLARVSTDGFGQLLRSHLKESGVLPTYLIDTDDLTTLAAVHLRDGHATYSFHAADAADRGLLPHHLSGVLDRAPLQATTAVHVGSIALVLEPAASTLDGLLRQEAGRRIVSLDPNIRPTLIPDREAYLRRFADWVGLVDILKVSEDDLGWMYPDRSEDEVVDGWLAGGVRLILVTHGREGARATTAAASVTAAAPRVDVVDTVGAGDAFMSAVLARLHVRRLLVRDALTSLDNPKLAELLEFACLIAADTCTRPGGDPPRHAGLHPSATA